MPSAEQVKLDRLLEAAAEAGLSDPIGALRQIPHEVVIDHGDICARLMTTAHKFKIDLVVIGTHGWRGVKKLLKGSTAEKITWLATGPVLTVGPRVSPRLGFKRISMRQIFCQLPHTRCPMLFHWHKSSVPSCSFCT